MNMLTNEYMFPKLRKRVLQCYLESIFLYSCEGSIINKTMTNQLEGTETIFLEKDDVKTRTDRNTKEEIVKNFDINES